MKQKRKAIFCECILPSLWHIPATENLCDLYEIWHRIQFQKLFRRFEFPEHFHTASHNWPNIVKEMCLSTFFYLLFYRGELRHFFPQKVVKFHKILCDRGYTELLDANETSSAFVSSIVRVGQQTVTRKLHRNLLVTVCSVKDQIQSFV
jgi:hypothetical protein